MLMSTPNTNPEDAVQTQSDYQDRTSVKLSRYAHGLMVAYQKKLVKIEPYNRGKHSMKAIVDDAVIEYIARRMAALEKKK